MGVGEIEPSSDYDFVDSFQDLDLRQQLPHTQKKRFFFPNDYVKRRLCIPPQMSCNTMPNSCCRGTTCRCNLWGQNCRCLRMGFFSTLGKINSCCSFPFNYISCEAFRATSLPYPHQEKAYLLIDIRCIFPY